MKRVLIFVVVCLSLLGLMIVAVRYGIAQCKKPSGVKPAVAAVATSEIIFQATNATNATNNVITGTTTISPYVTTNRSDVGAVKSNQNERGYILASVITITEELGTTNITLVEPGGKVQTTNALVRKTRTKVGGTFSLELDSESTNQVVTTIDATSIDRGTTVSSNATPTNAVATPSNFVEQVTKSESSNAVSPNVVMSTTNPATPFMVSVGVVIPKGGDVEKGKVGFEADLVIPVTGPLALEVEIMQFGDHLEAVDMTTLKIGASIMLCLEKGMWYGYGKIGLDYNQIDFSTELDGIDISVEGAFGQHFGIGGGCSFANRFGVLFDFTSYRLETTARVWGNDVSETVSGSYNHNLLKLGVTYRF